MTEFRKKIKELWANRDAISKEQMIQHTDLFIEIYDLLESGKEKICYKQDDVWYVDEELKQSMVLSLVSFSNILTSAYGTCAFDKIPLLFSNWNAQKFQARKIRAVPGSIVRASAFIDKNVVLMPSFVNIGSSIGENTMIDSYVTVGSCVNVGKSCHISSGVVLAGVLEPAQAKPVIIEDNVFVGANSVISEGMIIEQGSVIASGMCITQSTKIYDRDTKQISYGKIPAYSVAIPGVINSPDGDFGMNACIIAKKVDEKTRLKSGINDLLRGLV